MGNNELELSQKQKSKHDALELADLIYDMFCRINIIEDEGE